MSKSLAVFLVMLQALFLLLLPARVPGDADGAPTAPNGHAVILLYHHVDDSTPSSTSVTPERFADHLGWLADNGYQVMDLLPLLRALGNNEPVPDKAVAITFDDAWVSVHETAGPMLAERSMPFTVFVNTDAVDAGEGPVMSWDQIRAVGDMGGTLGSHSASHDHLPARNDRESEVEWAGRIDADLQRALDRLDKETGQRPTVFAYPYGEDTATLAKQVGGFHEFALVQRSGAVGPGSDFMALPRFPLATGFDGLDRLERAVRSRPLPVVEVSELPPADGIRETALLGVEYVFGDGAYRFDALACYSASGETLRLHRPADTVARRVRVETRGLDRPGRNKFNCTAPAADGSGDWYWHSHQWLRPPLE